MNRHLDGLRGIERERDDWLDRHPDVVRPLDRLARAALGVRDPARLAQVDPGEGSVVRPARSRDEAARRLVGTAPTGHATRATPAEQLGPWGGLPTPLRR